MMLYVVSTPIGNLKDNIPCFLVVERQYHCEGPAGLRSNF